MSYEIESNIRALVLLYFFYSRCDRDKMLGKPHILSLFLNFFDKFNETRALMQNPLYLLQGEHSCKLLYIK